MTHRPPALSARSSSSSSSSPRQQVIEPLESRRLLSAAAQRPIADFIAAQGTYNGPVFGFPAGTLIVPPAKNYLGWTAPQDNLGISVDYAGLANNYPGGTLNLGTTFDGNVVETRQRDGSSIVRVTLHTDDALTFVMPLDPAPTGNPFGDNPLVFGTRVTDVVNGATAAVGDSLFSVAFTSPQFGAPLPDIMQLVNDPQPGQNLLSIRFQATATGTFADGSPGMVKVSQAARFDTNPNHPPGRDFFPVENVVLIHTGGAAAAAAMPTVMPGVFRDGGGGIDLTQDELDVA
jgi:hypothetical protein